MTLGMGVVVGIGVLVFGVFYFRTCRTVVQDLATLEHMQDESHQKLAFAIVIRGAFLMAVLAGVAGVLLGEKL